MPLASRDSTEHANLAQSIPNLATVRSSPGHSSLVHRTAQKFGTAFAVALGAIGLGALGTAAFESIGKMECEDLSVVPNLFNEAITPQNFDQAKRNAVHSIRRQCTEEGARRLELFLHTWTPDRNDVVASAAREYETNFMQARGRNPLSAMPTKSTIRENAYQSVLGALMKEIREGITAADEYLDTDGNPTQADVVFAASDDEH